MLPDGSDLPAVAIEDFVVCAFVQRDGIVTASWFDTPADFVTRVHEDEADIAAKLTKWCESEGAPATFDEWMQTVMGKRA